MLSAVLREAIDYEGDFTAPPRSIHIEFELEVLAGGIAPLAVDTLGQIKWVSYDVGVALLDEGNILQRFLPGGS